MGRLRRTAENHDQEDVRMIGHMPTLREGMPPGKNFDYKDARMIRRMPTRSVGMRPNGN